MSRWKQLEGIEARLPDVSAHEITSALVMWREHLKKLRGPALKQGRKFLHRLERALEVRSADDADESEAIADRAEDGR